MYPDGTVALLNTYYRLMSEEITAHEGKDAISLLQWTALDDFTV
jgi:hypothetical protein